MKAIMRVGLLLSLCLLAIFGVQAEDDQGNVNDPNVNPRSNACYEGGSMAGQCDTPEEWEGGWYLIRFEYGLITREQFPAFYSYLLPGEETSTGDSSAPIVCYSGASRSVGFNGNSGADNNLTVWDSTDCTGTQLAKSSLSPNNPIIIVASTSTEAGQECRQSQADAIGIDNLAAYSLVGPSNVYICIGN